MIATAIDRCSTSGPNRTSAWSTPGRPPPWMSWKTAGRISAAVASSSMPACACAAVRLKVCFSRPMPPASIDAPSPRTLFELFDALGLFFLVLVDGLVRLRIDADGAAVAPVMTGLEGLHHLVALGLVDGDVVGDEHPVGALELLEVEDLLFERGRVV